MRSLHYPITLPDTFDMRTIERRVRDRAPAFDGLEGLALKAFLVTSIEHGADRTCTHRSMSGTTSPRWPSF
jgi:hypothetical protein